MRFLVVFLFLSVAMSQAQNSEPTNLFPDLPVKVESNEEHSIARNWNEMLLTAIRNDLARPTVHARNLFHSSALMYDLWSVINNEGQPYLLGQPLNEFSCPYEGYSGTISNDAVHEAISYGMYRFLKHRFYNVNEISTGLDWFFTDLGYNSANTSTDAPESDPAQLGNYLAYCYIRYGLQDGSNEVIFYANEYYWPVNEGLEPNLAGNPTFTNPNRWQPLAFRRGVIAVCRTWDVMPFSRNVAKKPRIWNVRAWRWETLWPCSRTHSIYSSPSISWDRSTTPLSWPLLI